MTICTQDRVESLGKVENGAMVLSQEGGIVERCWKAIPQHYHGVELDQFIIMPNHVHGIIAIVEAEQCSASTEKKQNNYGLLSKIIKSFKDITVKTIRKEISNVAFGWQRSFYDHIIRNEKSLNDTRQYVIENSLKWQFDEENLFAK